MHATSPNRFCCLISVRKPCTYLSNSDRPLVDVGAYGAHYDLGHPREVPVHGVDEVIFGQTADEAQAEAGLHLQARVDGQYVINEGGVLSLAGFAGCTNWASGRFPCMERNLTSSAVTFEE